MGFELNLGNREWWGSRKGAFKYLEDPNLLKLRSLDSSCPFFLSDNSIWDNECKCSEHYDRKAKIAFRTSTAVVAKGRN